MQSPLELALREHLADYLVGAVTLEEFKDWLVGATWDVDECGDSTAIDLAYEIKLALAEHSGGHATDEELRATLRDQLHRGTIVVSSARPHARVETGTSGTSITHRMTFPQSPVGTARAWVSVS